MGHLRFLLPAMALFFVTGCHERDSSTPVHHTDSQSSTAPVKSKDADKFSAEHADAIERANVARGFMDALPAALNELDEGGVIPECEAGDYQAFAQAEQTDMPSDIRAWIDEEFITVFLHNLD